jgi:FlgN protein
MKLNPAESKSDWGQCLIDILQAQNQLMENIKTELYLKKPCIIQNNLETLHQIDQRLLSLNQQINQQEQTRLALLQAHGFPPNTPLDALLSRLPVSQAGQLRLAKTRLKQQGLHVNALTDEVNTLLTQSIDWIADTVNELGHVLGGTHQTYSPGSKKKKPGATTQSTSLLPSSTVCRSV